MNGGMETNFKTSLSEITYYFSVIFRERSRILSLSLDYSSKVKFLSKVQLTHNVRTGEVLDWNGLV